MQRPIEFRAWDKNLKKMYPVESIDWGCLQDPGQGIYICGHSWLTFEQCEIMQYTGLKDKHGVKIFEGDIIKCGLYGQSIGEIVYINCSFGFLRNTGIGTDFIQIPIRHDFYNFPLEVIGNIHENPELLKG